MQIEAAALANDLIAYDPLILGIGPGASLRVDFTAFAGDPGTVAARAESWLQRLPCPSIALFPRSAISTSVRRPFAR